MGPGTRRPRPTWPDDVVDEALQLMFDKRTPTQTQRMLEERLGKGMAPSVDSLKRWRADLPPPAKRPAPWDPTGPDTSVDDCRRMAPLLLHGMNRATDLGDPSLGWPTDAEARWMLRVRAWAPSPQPAYPGSPSMSDARVWELGRYIAASDPDEQRRLVRSLVAAMAGPVDEGRLDSYRRSGQTTAGTATPELRVPAAPTHGGAATKEAD